jgi:hypothetical protein
MRQDPGDQLEDAQRRQAKASGITRGLRCGMPGRAGPAQRGAQASR